MTKIITDNVACDLSYEECEKYRISVLPVPLIIEGIPYKNLSQDELLRIRGKKISTSAINQEEYAEKIEEIYNRYNEPIIILTHPSRLGSSYNNAEFTIKKLKEKLINLNADLFDIGTIFAAGSLLVKKTRELSDKLPYESAVEELKRLIPRAKMYVSACLNEIGQAGASRLPFYISKPLSTLLNSPLRFYSPFSIGEGGKISLPRIVPCRKVRDADESLVNSLIDDVKKYMASTVEFMVNHTDYPISYELACKLEENVKNRLERIGINVIFHDMERFSSIVQNQAGQHAHGMGILFPD